MPALLGRRKSLCNRAGFVAALQNGVVQIASVRPPSIKRDNYTFAFRIHSDVAYSGNVHQWLAQLANAFVATFAFGCDCNAFEDRPVGVLQIVWVGRIKMMRVERLNHR